MEIGICLAMLAVLPFLYFIFGQTFVLCIGQKTGKAMCLLLGAFLYHGIFQIAALLLMLMRRPLSHLSLLWGLALAFASALWIFLRRRRKGRIMPALRRPRIRGWLLALMILAVLIQMYYVIFNEYLGWDTSSYVGTIATSVQRNSMYRYDGESGQALYGLPMRYALSSFYLHAAVWCQVLKLNAVSYAKIVQGGVLCILADTTIFQLGTFLFAGTRYRKFSQTKRSECAAAMVIAAVWINFFYKTIFTTSDFLLNRALEAKGYCANFILPFLFLLGLMIWRDGKDRLAKQMLLIASFGCVPISMSAMITAPALITVMLLPVLLREKTWKMLRCYLLCILPNAVYFIVYALYIKGLIKVRVS